MYSRRASRIREERLTRARLAAPFVARSNSESKTTWMVSMLWKILHNRINSQSAGTRVQRSATKMYFRQIIACRRENSHKH